MKVKDYTKLLIDLDSVANELSKMDFPGQDSNQDPCFTSDESGFENCIYNDCGELLWGYTILITQEQEKLSVAIHMLDADFICISDKGCFEFDIDTKLERIANVIKKHLKKEKPV